MKRVYTILLLLLPFCLFAQTEKEHLAGTSLSVELQKELNRHLRLSLEEEVRLVTNRVGFDRSATSLGLDYSLFNKRFKVGAYYTFLYLYNNDYRYEARHRYYLNLSFSQPVNRFNFTWRGRLQGTSRNESKGSYKINPKYVMRHRLQAEYDIMGSPWKPYLSCEVSSELNNPKGNELTKIRYQAGTSWRLNRTDYLEFFLRYDSESDYRDDNVIMLGIGFRKKL
ncbi:DUF2490 domain-containing protein [Parabacteroides sp. OttesenSCG-928-N08]|nr:DUF2490 domain-containing protein [Parabacteroides sp. OttesenSCG-928-N08]